MINKVAIIISPNWHDYAEKYLVDCVEGLKEQDFSGSFKLFLTDNESSAESVSFIKQLSPEIEIIANKKNDGFAKGNNDAIKKAINGGFEYFVLINMDTVVASNWLRELTEAAEKLSDWGAVQSRVMLFSDKNKINSLGNSLHYLGFGFSAGGGRKWVDYVKDFSSVRPVTYFSGVAVLLKKDILERVGFFDEKFWMYHDDLELSWKIRLLGKEIYLAPGSVVYHKYQFAKSIRQYYWMERNRFICLLTNYKIATNLLILPALILMELGLALFSLVNGFFWQKLRVYGWLINPRHWGYLVRRRRQIKKIRQVPDKKIIRYFTGRIEFQEINNPILKYFGNPFFNGYWWLVKKIIFW